MNQVSKHALDPDIFYLPKLHKENNKPAVGISACLLGEQVRYDGASKQHELISTTLAHCLQLEKFCPEVSAGLSVPRPPVHLVESGKEIRAIGVDDRSMDVTGKLQKTAETYSHENISGTKKTCGFIFKARSPSCGLSSTPLYNTRGESLEKTSGLFASHLKNHHHDCLWVEESFFTDTRHCRLFAFFCHLLEEVRWLEKPVSRHEALQDNQQKTFLAHYSKPVFPEQDVSFSDSGFPTSVELAGFFNRVLNDKTSTEKSLARIPEINSCS